MANKIEKLTSEQEDYLVEFRQKWLDIGLCCEPANFDKAEEQITFFYKKLGKKKPIFFRFSSPLMCEFGLVALKILLKKQNFEKTQLGGQLWDQLGDQLGGQLWDQLWDQLGDQLRDQLRDQLGDQLGDQLRGQLWAQLWDQLGDQLRDQLRAQLWDQLGDQLRDQLWDQLRDQLRDQLWDQLGGQLGGQLWGQLGGQLWGQLGDQLRDQLRDQLKNKEFLNNCFHGQHEAAWKAFYLFGKEIGVKYKDDDIKLLNAWGAIAGSCCWWSPWEGICIISDRPRLVKFDDQKRLHNENDMAVKFSDGWGVYSWHGTRIDPSWILDKKNLKPETVLKTTNLEQRRAGCEIIGWVNILRQLNAKTIQKDDDPEIGELLEVDLPDSGKEKFLKVQCGTKRTFAIPVPPEMKTALQANAWTFGIDDWKNFKPEIRT